MIVIIGAGGHARIVAAAAAAAGIPIDRAFDDAFNGESSVRLLGVTVDGPIPALLPGIEAHVAIGSNRVRRSIALARPDWRWRTIPHPRACIDPSVSIGNGSLVCAGAVLQVDCVIGVHAIINTAASIDHDCLIGDFVHVAPGATLAGNVQVGNCAFIGAGSTVIPGVTIGEGAVVGAGAVVLRDIPAHDTVVGNPARAIRRD